MAGSVSNAASSASDDYMADFYKLQQEADDLEAKTDAEYAKWYSQASAGDTKDIPTDALQNMADDSSCSADAFNKIVAELQSRGESVDTSAIVAQHNNALYADYYERASDGKTADIPTDALQNMAMDSTCSKATYAKIAAELASRNEPVDRDAAAAAANDALYAGYYAKAQSNDVADIPTEALQNMGMDINCSPQAYKNISEELGKRGATVERDDSSAASDTDALYTKYYEMASNNDVSTIPTEALQNMANDPNCSVTAYNYIADELEFRDEPIDPNDDDEDD